MSWNPLLRNSSVALSGRKRKHKSMIHSAVESTAIKAAFCNNTHETGKYKEDRHKGRIERLRVLLAYGFEARTQHQLSSSRRGGAATQPQTNTRTHTYDFPSAWPRPTAISRKVIIVAWFHRASNCLDHNDIVHHLTVACPLLGARAACGCVCPAQILRGCCYTHTPRNRGG